MTNREYYLNVKSEVVKKYTLPDGQSYKDDLDINKELVMCQLLIEEMESLGATRQELDSVFTYMVTAANAKRNNLDWAKAYEDCKIDQFVENYIEKKGEKRNEK